MKLPSLRKAVVGSCRDLCENGLMCNLGAGGNVSVRDAGSGLIALTPSQFRYDAMAAEDIVVVSENGDVVEASEGRVPTSELQTHTRIYKLYAGVNAIVHTHAPVSSALASVMDEIPALTYELLYLVGRSVPVIPFTMPGTSEMAESVAEALRTTCALIIRNHGMFVTGETLDEAVVRAVSVEDAARLYHIARTIGTPQLLPADVEKPRH